LLPISLLYFIASKIRYFIARPEAFEAKVICIGNATVGGTGKTQLVRWLASLLVGQDMKVVIVCKGYKGKAKTSMIVTPNHSARDVGDEAKYLSKITTVVISKEVQDCIKLVNSLNPDIIIMDDFLQNPNFIKNIGILVVDSDRMYGNGMLLPAGPLRQSVASAMRNASAVIAVGSGAVSSKQPDLQTFFAQIVSLQKFDMAAKYIAFAGIGNPERFFSCLKFHGLQVINELKFPDHYDYSHDDLKNLQKMAHNQGAMLITTPKDAVKIDIATLVFEPELKFYADDEKLILTKIYEDLKKNTIFI
jgi:tetraacyldisaccharide 4'-kinase